MTEKQDSGGIKGSIAKDDNKKAKATAAIPMAGAIVIAALLLSGLSLISSYQQPVIAQQNVTGGGDGAVGGGILEGRNATNGTTTAGGVAAGGNQSTSEVRMNIEQARMTLQNNDTQGAMMYLDMALNALGGNGTASAQGNTTANSTIAGSNAITTGSQNGIPPVGGTSAADEDNDNGANDNGANDNGANDNGADGDEEGESNIEGEDPNEFEDCVIVGGRDVGDVGC